MTLSKINSISKNNKKEITYDITCNGDNLFYANGILTHNSGANEANPDLTATSECLDFYTIVNERNKGDVYIKDVEVGDQLQSHDGYNVVRMKHCPKTKKAYKITTKSGKEIICSADHKFPTDKGRISINEGLSKGTKISS